MTAYYFTGGCEITGDRLLMNDGRTLTVGYTMFANQRAMAFSFMGGICYGMAFYATFDREESGIRLAVRIGEMFWNGAIPVRFLQESEADMKRLGLLLDEFEKKKGKGVVWLPHVHVPQPQGSSHGLRLHRIMRALALK